MDVAAESLMVEVTGDSDKVDSLINLLRGFGIKELSRTGRLSMVRGEKGPLAVNEISPAQRQSSIKIENVMN